MFLTQTDVVGSWPWHKFHSAAIAGRAGQKSAEKDPRGRLQAMATIIGLSEREAWRFTDRFMERVKVRRFSSDYFVKGGILKAAHADVLDTEYAKEAMQRILAGTVGFEGFAKDLVFDAVPADRPIGDFPEVPSFSLWTNIDFAAGNALRKSRNPTLKPVSEATLLNVILEARADAAVSAFYGAEFYTSAVNSSMA